MSSSDSQTTVFCSIFPNLVHKVRATRYSESSHGINGRLSFGLFIPVVCLAADSLVILVLWNHADVLLTLARDSLWPHTSQGSSHQKGRRWESWATDQWWWAAAQLGNKQKNKHLSLKKYSTSFGNLNNNMVDESECSSDDRPLLHAMYTTE